MESGQLNRRIVDETLAYVRQELTRLAQDLTWADGAQAETFRVRRARLLAELDRLESLRRTLPE